MPILGALLVLIQVCVAVHALQTGRGRTWIWAIMFLPGLGCAAYLLTQVLPELFGRRRATTAGQRLIDAADPRRELRRRKDQLLVNDSIEKRVRLAGECMEVGLNIEAITLFESSLTGRNENDPGTMLKLAEAQFRADDFDACVATLDALIAANPQFRSPAGHLLYARALTALGRLDAAASEYAVLLVTFPGEEARVRFAQLLEQRGDPEGAARLYDEALTRARRAPAHYRRSQHEWLELAAAGVRGRT